MLLSVAYFASGAAQFVHEVLEHSDPDEHLPVLLEKAIDSGSLSVDHHSSQSGSHHHHHDHDDCPVCQMLAAMHVALPGFNLHVAVSEPVVEFIKFDRQLPPVEITCDDCLLARPPPAILI